MTTDFARYYAAWGSEASLRNGAVISGDLVARLTGTDGVPREAVRLRGSDSKIVLPGARELSWPAGSGTLARLEDITVGGGGASSAFEQSFTLATSVVVNHAFGAYPIVQVFDTGGNVFIPLGIEHTSTNSLTVTFASSRSGTIVANYGGGSGGGGLSSLTTDDVAEGTLNLYYTDGRADARIAAAVGVSVQAHSAVLDATTASFTTVDEAKLDFISITQAVDLDAIETRVNALDAAVILRGSWDASAGTFPGGGTAQAGDSYIVSVAGTVDGVSFALNDRIIAITDNASTATFAANWFKADYTDQVLSVFGRTGAVVGVAGDYSGIYEPADAFLTSIAALGTAADRMLYTTAIDTAAETPLTAAARTVLDDATVDDMLTTLGGAAYTGTGGVVRATGPTLTDLNITSTNPIIRLTDSDTGALSFITANNSSGSLSIRADNNNTVAGSVISFFTDGTGRVTLDASALYPAAAGGLTLGTSSLGWGSLYLDGMTAGSVPFFGASGLLSQDKTNFFWDDANNRLGVGTASPTHSIHVSQASPIIKLTDTTTSADHYLWGDSSGGSLSVFADHGNYSGSSNLQLWLGGSARATLTRTAFNPATSGGLTLGTSSLPWGDAYAKTLFLYTSGGTAAGSVLAPTSTTLSIRADATLASTLSIGLSTTADTISSSDNAGNTPFTFGGSTATAPGLTLRQNLILTATGGNGYIDIGEYNTTTDAAAPSADRARVYVRDNGAGKEQLVCRFATGAVQVLATEP